MVFKGDKNHSKIPNTRMDCLQKESFYWDHQPSMFHTNACKFNSDKMTKRSSYYYKDSMDASSDYPSFFASKTYSNVHSSILSYIVGGFVGSKVQMNTHKKHNLSYDLSAAISNLLNPWKTESEKTPLRKNGESFCRVSSKIQSDSYDKYIVNKSTGGQNVKDKNCIIDMVDIECLISLPIKDFVEKRHCVLDMNQNCSESQTEKKKRSTINLGNASNCDINQVNSIKKSSSGSWNLEKKQLNLETDKIQPESQTEMVVSGQSVTLLGEEMGSRSIVHSERISDTFKPTCCNSIEDKNSMATDNSPRTSNKQEAQLRHSSNYLASERFRQQSECSVESTDSESFIIFEDHPDVDDGSNYKKNGGKSRYCDMENLSDYDDDDDYEDDDDEDDDEYEDESDEEESDSDEEDYTDSGSSDEYDFCSVNNNVLLANDKWLRSYHDVIVDENQSLKKVKFNEKVTVKKIVAWDHAYRTARLGPWEQLARDRVRFQERISRLSSILLPILTVEHRNKIRKRLTAS